VSLLAFIAARVRELRERHGLTQEQVAALLGTDIKWYQRVEWCQKDVRASTIERLAEVFGVTAVQFLAENLPDTKVRSTPAAPHRPRSPKSKPRAARQRASKAIKHGKAGK
jgi:transcriptional regulator with XRE-family HTH domain